MLDSDLLAPIIWSSIVRDWRVRALREFPVHKSKKKKTDHSSGFSIRCKMIRAQYFESDGALL
jgi:hypothetical protein